MEEEKMPTTASSNYPHVRLSPEAHAKLRRLAGELGVSQGNLIDHMTEEVMAELGLSARCHEKRRREWVGRLLTKYRRPEDE
jgi:hypothetical protein